MLRYTRSMGSGIRRAFSDHDIPRLLSGKELSSLSRKRVTIYDIAREAGVSAATVTRVLNGADSVRAETREKVQQIIDAHGYAPSTVAQDLGSGSTKTIGIILPGIQNPYYAALVSAADDEARASGYSLWLYQLPREREISAHAQFILTTTIFLLMNLATMAKVLSSGRQFTSMTKTTVLLL